MKKQRNKNILVLQAMVLCIGLTFLLPTSTAITTPLSSSYIQKQGINDTLMSLAPCPYFADRLQQGNQICVKELKSDTQYVVSSNYNTKLLPSSSIIYVGGIGPNNYSTIQEGIKQAKPGDTVFVFDDSSPYYEHVLVDRSISLIGENKETTIIDGEGVGNVVNISADSVTLEGFTIQNAGDTYLIDWGGDKLVGLYAYADSGIYVLSDYNVIKGNIITNNPYHGIHLHDYSEYNEISNNIVTNTGTVGIFLQFSSNNIISENTVIDNSYHGIHLLQNCNGNTISDNIITNNNCALEISGNWASSNNKIVDNSIINNRVLGIYLYIQCYNTVISNNTIIDNGHIGVVIYQMCDGSTILDNIIKYHEEGIIAEIWIDNLTISGNTVANHSEIGIVLQDFVDLSTITRNKISDNNYGIYSSDSDNNIFSENIISDNQHGIYSPFMSDNLFYHNNFIENGENAYVHGGTNLWDNGYPSGGNYWSDHSNFIDLFSGPDQNEPGSDCICDIPYQISGEDNEDLYPLMEPWNPAEARIINIRSLRDHDGKPNQSILVNYPSSFEDDNITSETRDGGIQRLRIEFDRSLVICNYDDCLLIDYQSGGPDTHPGNEDSWIPFEGTTIIINNIIGNTLILDITGLDSCATYRFTIGSSVSSIADSFQIRNLLGDMNDDGYTNALDKGPLYAMIIAGSFNPKCDLNLDGAVNALDKGPYYATILSDYNEAP